MSASIRKKTRWTTSLFHSVRFLALGYIQAIIAMRSLKDQPSSNLSFAFYTDVFFAVGITTVLYFFVFLFLQRIKQIPIQLIVHGIFVCLLWFWIDWGIFEDREAGWSTYTTLESLHATWGFSFWWIIGGCALFLWGSWRDKR